MSTDARFARPPTGSEMSDAPSYAESLYPELELGWAPLHAWRTAGSSSSRRRDHELYDLENDPSETTNRVEEEHARANELAGKLEVALRRTPAPAAAAPVDAETAERLRALGYVSGGRVSRPAGAALRDPKDGIRFLPRLNRGMSAARTEPELAITRADARCSRKIPGCSWPGGRAPSPTPPRDVTISPSRTCASLDKEGELTPEDAVVLGDNLRFAGRLEEAALILERAARENPTFAQPLISLAEVRIQERKYDEAAAVCERVLKLVPDHIEALRRLGDLALLRDDLTTAAARYARILAIDAGDVAAITKSASSACAVGNLTRRCSSFVKQSSTTPATLKPCCTWRARWPPAVIPRRPCHTSSGRSKRVRHRRWH